MKLLITPPENNYYYIRMINEFAQGFIDCGVQVFTFNRKLSENEMNNFIKLNKINFNFQINNFRTGNSYEYCRNITWLQDYHYMDFQNPPYISDHDIVYTMGSKQNLGIRTLRNYKGCLYSGVSQDILSKEINCHFDLDISLCGFIPSPNLIDQDGVINNIIDRIKALNLPLSLRKSLKKYIDSHYVPLSGSLNVFEITTCLENIVNEYNFKFGEIPFFNLLKKHAIFKSMIYYSNTYPRLLDRKLLADEAINLSSRTKFYGIGWDLHYPYQKYYGGVCVSKDSLIDVYRRSSINLCNNTHGIFMHSRVLECMAVGGLVFHHECPNNPSLVNGLFPNFHFVEYNRDNLRGKMVEWLNAPHKQIYDLKMNAKRFIIENHTWTHRAVQVLRDLD